MQSQAADVEAYLAEVPLERRAALEKLRTVCLSVPGLTECMEYGMPCYKRGDTLRLSFASQKQYISLYVMNPTAVSEFAPLLKASTGKSCIRFKRPADMDFGVIERLLQRVG